ncbi:hypothetical protein [Flavobacterium restrictum]|uniref:hypothetical protein n=1 Tax=Flavobacterium restrictum TaxID=2594428 RepID=UPI001F304553|nr:hypothetical protein [Flavobacterium restrictum]
MKRKLVYNTCNGRCELQKSLTKFENNQKEMQNNLKEKFELVYIQNLFTTDFAPFPIFEKKDSNFSFFTQKTNSISQSTFRPPASFI